MPRNIARPGLSLAFLIGLLTLSTSAWAQSDHIDAVYLAAMRQRSLAADAIGDFKLQTGDLNGARSAFFEGLALARHLVAAEPNNTQWQADVVVSLWKLAAVTPDRPAKIASLREALAFVDKLEGQHALKPNQRGWRAMIEAEIAKPAADDATGPQPNRRSSRAADGFTARQH